MTINPDSTCIFPPWGKYGVRIEYRPPTAQFKNPKILISEVMKDAKRESGWKFYMRDFNPQQKERGIYNAHCGVPVEAIPQIIAELMKIWEVAKPANAEEITEEAAALARQATLTQRESTLLKEAADMSELHEGRSSMPHGGSRRAGRDDEEGEGEFEPEPPPRKDDNPDDFIPF